MKRTTLFLIFITAAVAAFSQTYNFTWLNGSGIFNASATYGNRWTEASTNIPGARENAMIWKDSNDMIWIFGGHGYNASSNQGYLNDLWRYNVATGQWTWMAGTAALNQAGNYGSKGVADSSNVPPSRQNGVTWTDASGDLWLFGGQTSGNNAFLNDLWKFDVSTGMWTWMSGSNSTNQQGVFGTQNVSSSANVPGARFGACGWSDGSGHLWMLGGQEYFSAQQRSNDLWSYDIATNQWTWVTGSDQADQNGVYGTKGIASSTNTPGARQASITWTDASGNFWLFGGYGFPESGTHSYLNDLWKFDPVSKQWTWMSGAKTTNQIATYGTSGVSSVNNIPGARQMSVSWYGNDGKLWLFGGWGHVSIGVFGRLNDLWNYDPTSGAWTWCSGANSPNAQGVYGSQGVASTSNIPGARRMAIGAADNSGRFYLFGGNGYDSLDSLGLMNDLWRIYVSSITALQEMSDPEVQVFPNPFHGVLNISLSDRHEHSLRLYNSSGVMVFQKEFADRLTIDEPEFSKGIYLLMIDDRFRKKLMLQ